MNFDFCWLKLGIGEPLFGGKVTSRRLLPGLDFEMLHRRNWYESGSDRTEYHMYKNDMWEERIFNTICATAMRDTVRTSS